MISPFFYLITHHLLSPRALCAIFRSNVQENYYIMNGMKKLFFPRCLSFFQDHRNVYFLIVQSNNNYGLWSLVYKVNSLSDNKLGQKDHLRAS
jgi:hypothetical protein